MKHSCLILIALFTLMETVNAQLNYFETSEESGINWFKNSNETKTEFGEWLEIFKWSTRDSELEKIAIEKMNQLALTPQEIFLAYLEANVNRFPEANKQLKEKVICELETMKLEEIHFDCLLAIIDSLEESDPSLERVFKISSKTAKTFENWYWFYFKIPKNHQLRSVALENFQKLATDCQT